MFNQQIELVYESFESNDTYDNMMVRLIGVGRMASSSIQIRSLTNGAARFKASLVVDQ
ncbi:hypothetical protein [Psychromonas sp. MB-3u-54]|uniref:hypothetical protein n=1 Tax=Psychromonas sp. MB-3u-54 TaxID=2058319 RepID=UPI0012FED1EC|nr:hypothetical protein [Psychromonas sp. MB-3u-54]